MDGFALGLLGKLISIIFCVSSSHPNNIFIIHLRILSIVNGDNNQINNPQTTDFPSRVLYITLHSRQRIRQ